MDCYDFFSFENAVNAYIYEFWIWFGEDVTQGKMYPVHSLNVLYLKIQFNIIILASTLRFFQAPFKFSSYRIHFLSMQVVSLVPCSSYA